MNGADAACASTALVPAPSALYVLFDESSGMRDFLGLNVANAAQGLPPSVTDLTVNAVASCAAH